MPSVFTVSARIWCRRGCASRTELKRYCSPKGFEKALSSFMGARSRNLRTGDGREMPRHLRAELNRLRRRLVTILELIREVEAERDKLVVTTLQDRTSRKIVALCRIRGLGENFAAVLTREVFYRSFG